MVTNISTTLPFPENCCIARFIARHKRFTIECEHNGTTIYAHSNNSGSMLGLLRKGTPLFISPASNPDRKLPFTLEMVYISTINPLLIELRNLSQGNTPSGCWVGVNTLAPNRMLKQAFLNKSISWLADYSTFKGEVAWKGKNAPSLQVRTEKEPRTRFDAMVSADNKPDFWIEAKNVTLVEDGGIAAFPDAVSVRAQRHLHDLVAVKQQGYRAGLFLLIQYPVAHCFQAADYIDPTYAQAFYATLAQGIECYVHLAHPTINGIALGRQIPVLPTPQ